MSAQEPPAGKKPLSKKLGAKALAALLSRQVQAVSKGWGELLGGPVSFGAVTAAEAHPTGLTKALPWPAAAVAVAVEGGFQGRFLVLAAPADAAILAGKPAEPKAEGLTPDVIEGLGKLFAPFCVSVQESYRNGPDQKLEVRQEAARLLADMEKLPEAGVATDGWLAELKMALGEGKAIQLWVLFPLALGTALAEAHHAAEAAATAAPKSSKGTILVVDDQHSIRTLIRRHLEKEGFAVVECTNGEGALLQLAKKEKPSAVVLDVMMPGMDGYEVCRRLRALPDGKGVPVVMCTGKGQRQDVMEALQAGANDYVVKPFTREILLAKLGKVMAPPPAQS